MICGHNLEYCSDWSQLTFLIYIVSGPVHILRHTGWEILTKMPQTCKFPNILADIFGLGAYFSKPIFALKP